MAISEIKGQNNYVSGYNELVHVFSSTNVLQPKFKFIVDIYNGVVAPPSYKFRLLISPEPIYNYGVADVHRLIEGFLSSDLGDETATTGITTNPNSIYNYRIDVGEQYEVAGVITDFPSLFSTSNILAINSALTRNEFIDFDFNDYLTNTSNDNFLTRSPLTQKIGEADFGWLYLLPFDANNPDAVEIKTYDSSGVLLGTWKIDNTTSFFTDAEKHLKFPSGTKNLNQIDNSFLSLGVQPIITSNTAKYEIRLLNNISAPISKTMTFNIDKPCKYPQQRLIFLNSLGGFDAFNFNLVSTTSFDLERKFYKKNPNRLTATDYLYKRTDREKIQYFTKSTKKMKLTSDWISEEESEWLRELVESPEIYLQTDKGLEAISNIAAKTYENKTDVKDKLFNLEVEIEFGYDNYRQRG